MGEIAGRIRAYLEKEVVKKGTEPLRYDTELLGRVLDSMDMLMVVAYLEEEFDVYLEDVDVTPRNLGTIADMERLIERKVTGAPPSGAVELPAGRPEA